MCDQIIVYMRHLAVLPYMQIRTSHTRGPGYMHNLIHGIVVDRGGRLGMKRRYGRDGATRTLPVSTPGTRLVLNIRSYWDEHMGIVFRSMS